jgi:HK97 family phage major capsid protein
MPYDPTYAHLDSLQVPELRERRNELMTKARELGSSGELTGDDLKDFESLEAEITEVQRRTEQLESLMRHARNPWAVESGDGNLVRDERTGEWVGRDRDHPSGTRTSSPGPFGVTRDQGLRVIERHKDILTPEAGDRLDKLVRRDRFGLESRYLDAVGNPDYESAFGKLLAHPQDAHYRFTREETAAVQAVADSIAERGMTEGTGSAGGFGIPISIDPTILLASNGVLNPVRDIARTITVGTRETRLVSSVGAAASFDAEEAEVSDDTIALVQPTIVAQMARMFVPYSYELGDDYASLVTELGRVIVDEKDKLESTMFLSGNGTNQPVGLLAIGTTGSLTTTQRVQTDVAATLDIDDWWDLRGTFGSLRWAPAGTLLANPKTLDNAFRFTPAGSTTEPQAMPTREGPFMGLPKREWSEMVSTTTTGSKVGIVGDFSNYVIADRIGLEVEIVPTLFGTTHRPTGQKGVFARWRVGTVVAVPNAFRYLEVL